MFYVAQWTTNIAINPPTMDAIPLWALVRGVPFDLFTRKGLSLVAGLIGEPVELGELIIRMINLDIAHLKVKANCKKTLPSTVDLKYDDGSVIPVSVEYPCTPLTFPCCKQLGHLKLRYPFPE